MVERITLTPEQAEALQKLRAEHSNDSPLSDEADWMSVDDDTRPAKVLVLPDTGAAPI